MADVKIDLAAISVAGGGTGNVCGAVITVMGAAEQIAGWASCAGGFVDGINEDAANLVRAVDLAVSEGRIVIAAVRGA